MVNFLHNILEIHHFVFLHNYSIYFLIERLNFIFELAFKKYLNFYEIS